MKTFVIIFSILGMVTLNSCNQNTDMNTLLEKDETRNEIFNSILNNHDFMMEFMKSMHTSNHAMQMMQGDKKMMEMMMSDDGIHNMMKDSTMMKGMMHSMMTDKNTMSNMMNMMHENGMMDKDCMNSCMKMMQEKGMGMMNKKKKDGGSPHH